MAKYIANPVEVDAFKITRLGDMFHSPRKVGQEMVLEDGRTVLVAPEFLSRITPKLGDYYVVQADGYVYLNPAAVFERKYSPKLEYPTKVIGSDGKSYLQGDPNIPG